jgi:hypothetical protein
MSRSTLSYPLGSDPNGSRCLGERRRWSSWLWSKNLPRYRKIRAVAETAWAQPLGPLSAISADVWPTILQRFCLDDRPDQGRTIAIMNDHINPGV